METDEETNSNLHAAQQRTEHKGHSWSTKETRFLLSMYEKNAHNIGPNKTFRSKLHLWNEITRNLNKSFSLQRTTVQCIGRFKALKSKNSKGSTNNWTTKSSVAPNELSSSDDNTETTELSDTDTTPLAIAEFIRSTLLEIHELKEEAKERRHRERMKLLEKFLHQESASVNKVPAAPVAMLEDENEVARSAILGVQRASENDNQAMRARLLEMQRKKMEDRERKQRVSITPKQHRLPMRDLK